MQDQSQRSDSEWDAGTLDVEIERMSKDADALLESLREVAGPSPVPNKTIVTAKRSNDSIQTPSLDSFLNENVPPNEGPRYYTDDDDMSDTGSVTSLIKRELGNELRKAEKEFTTKEKAAVVSANLKASVKDEKIEESLILLMTIVWSVVIFLASFASRYMMNDDGRISFPFLA